MRLIIFLGLIIGVALGFLQLAESDTGALRPEIFIARNWSWSGTQTFSSVFGSVVTESGTSRSLSASDCGKTIETTSSSSVTVTLPVLGVGCHVAVVQMGTGQVTFTTSSTTLHNSQSFTKTSGRYAGVGVSVIESAVWVLFGDGA